MPIAAVPQVRIKQEQFALIDAPHLRIVPHELWKAVEKRLQAQRRLYLRDTNGNLWGRPESGRHSRYLLSGLARCGICVANIVALSAGAKNGFAYYICGYNHNRDATVCNNDHRPRVERIDQPVLDAVERNVLTPDAITYVIDRAVQLYKERQAENPEQPKLLEAELRRVRKELDNYLALIAQGDAPASVLAEITKRGHPQGAAGAAQADERPYSPDTSGGQYL